MQGSSLAEGLEGALRQSQNDEEMTQEVPDNRGIFSSL